ncbi:hypothetical protein [Mesorhizobium sp.]|uniref:hypothetical protein n=1 Tax=Mesorhizobium sp. TaxID=1871066 RepID=UPI000FE98FE9|nr:hypothetical protein [Mesorhizobium sp.]RWK68313.1 MAG: restriction endonuclease subunit S [Mesorhizobium sp.]
MVVPISAQKGGSKNRNNSDTQGCKETEIGLIPKDWSIQTFNQIFDFLPTAINSRADLSQDGDVYYIHYGDIHTRFHGHLDFQYKSPPRIDSRRCRNAAKVRNGDWVMADASEDIEGVGKSVEICGLRQDAISGLHTYLLREKASTFVPGFKGHLADSPQVRAQYVRAMTGMKVFGVSKGALRKLLLPIPPKREQELIAKALSDADGLIEGLENLIGKKRQIKKGAMQELLSGGRRLPGFEGEWGGKTFAEIFDFYPTATNSRADLNDAGDTYYIHYGDIHTRFHSHLNLRDKQPPKIARHKCRNAAHVRNGDWIMADASEDFDGVCKSVEVLGLSEGDKVVSGLHTFLLREKVPTFVPGFKGHLGNLKSLRDQYLRVMTGMKVFGVSKAALRDLVLPIPGPKEQDAIVRVLSNMDADIVLHEDKVAKARHIKQGMMQDLLTGRVRLI